MKLFCVKMKYRDEAILDVFHIVSESAKDAHKRLDLHMEECEKVDYPVTSYSFFEVQDVDGFNIDVCKTCD